MDYQIKLARESDMMDVFELANDPLVRKNSFHQNQIKIEDHKKWFSAGLKNKNCYFYIIRSDVDFIASVRFDLVEENQFLIGIQIAEKFRGRGLASRIIIDTTAKLFAEKKPKKIIAHIKTDNVGSLKSFLKSGYKITDKSQKNNSEFYILENEFL